MGGGRKVPRRRATRSGRRFSSRQGSAMLQQFKPKENEFQSHIPAVLRRNFSLFPLPRAHTSLARLPPVSLLRDPTYGVDGMECPSHWPRRHSLRWHRPPNWLATPDPPPTPPQGCPAPRPRSTARSLLPPRLPPHAQPSSTRLERGPSLRSGPAPRAHGSINIAALQPGESSEEVRLGVCARSGGPRACRSAEAEARL